MSSSTSAAINLLNTIIGAGLLAMPFGIRANGLFLGVLVIVFSACCSMFGLYLQGRCSKFVKPGHASFFALSQITYPSLSVLFDLGIAIKCFGVGISYLVVIGDLMPKIMDSLITDDEYLNSHKYLLERNFWITVLMAFVVAPLLFLRKLDSLRYASMVALSSVAYLSVLVIEHFLKGDIPDTIKGDVRYFEPLNLSSMLSAFPLFVFAYTCHQNMFSLVNELKNKSIRNIEQIIISAIGIAMLLYIFVGSTGYLTFGDNVTGNIIVMYPASVSSTVGRIAIVMLVTLSFPLQCHPARGSINHIIHYVMVRRIEIESRASSFSANVRRSALGIYRRAVLITGINQNSPPSNVNNNSRTVSARMPIYQEPEYGEQSNLLVTSNNSIQQHNSFIDEPYYDNEDAISFSTTTASLLKSQQQSSKNTSTVTLGTKKFIILTSIIVITSYLVACRVQSLEHVLGFVGATGSTSISFILPGIFGYKMIASIEYNEYYEEREDDNENISIDGGHTNSSAPNAADTSFNSDAALSNREFSNKDRMIKYLSLGLSIWGVMVMIVCLYAVIFLGAGH